MVKYILVFMLVFSAPVWAKEIDLDNNGVIDDQFLPGNIVNPVTISQTQAEDSTSSTVYSWTPQRVWQAIAKWYADNLGSMAIVDAPASDDKQYAFKNGGWVEVTAGGIADAPSDGTEYLRKDGAWAHPTATGPSYSFGTGLSEVGGHVVNTVVDTNTTYTSGDFEISSLADVGGLRNIWSGKVSFPGFTSLSADYSFGTADINTDGTIKNDSHSHGSSTITETDPTVDTSGEIVAIIGASVYEPFGITASEVAVTTTNFGGIFANDASHDTGQELFDLLDDHTHTSLATSGFNVMLGGVSITAADEITVTMPYALTITGYTILADQSGSIQVDVWKDSYANHPPTDADTITASAPIAISSATKATDTTLTGWTKSVSAGDVLIFHVDSVTSILSATIMITGTR